MEDAGIHSRIFDTFCSRGAMASKSLVLGARLEDILNAADSSSDSIFKMFYFKLVVDVASLMVSKL